ncbi:MAG TPA: tetratricopeptide repeat protein, partial [Pyrinomonadaceae bacterium]
MSLNFRQHRITLIIIGLVVVIGASLAPFMSASCSTRQQQGTTGELKALETLRAMTSNGVLPAEDAVARIEAEFPDTKAAGLARMVRARIKLKANDYAGAASLLEAGVIRERTALGDYALLLRARALEQAGRRVEARAAYEQLARDYPSSMRAREGVLRSAEMVMQDGQAAGVPLLLKELTEKNDPAALSLAARASEQAGDTTRALAAYRRLYFYSPAATESADAATAIARLGSTTAPASAEEATTRAERLYEAKRYADAFNAYTDAFARYPNAASPQAQLRRGTSAMYARRTADAVTALNGLPTSAGELRAEALYYLVQTYAGARQWDQVRATLEEMRRAFPQSAWTPRALVNAGRIAEDAKNTTDASFFFRTAVSAYPGAAEVAQAQFEIAWAAHEAKNYQESSRL